MSAKAPIYLKRASRRGKKEKLRDVLSSDMISPPLGDFRHTIHIGSGGGANDLFGDLSFLRGKFHLLPSGQARAPPQRPHPHPRPASVCGNPPFPPRSHLLKNAISLPVIGAPARPQAPPPKPPRLHLDSKTTAPPVPGQDPSPDARRRVPEDRLQERAYLPHASSLLSLHLDLGPSILDDVLQIMDSQCVSLNGACVHGGRQGILT